MGKGAKGSVQINGAFVAVGADHNGVRIAEIAENGVWLEFEGERRLFAVETGRSSAKDAPAKSKKSGAAK